MCHGSRAKWISVNIARSSISARKGAANLKLTDQERAITVITADKFLVNRYSGYRVITKSRFGRIFHLQRWRANEDLLRRAVCVKRCTMSRPRCVVSMNTVPLGVPEIVKPGDFTLATVESERGPTKESGLCQTMDNVKTSVCGKYELRTACGSRDIDTCSISHYPRWRVKEGLLRSAVSCNLSVF